MTKHLKAGTIIVALATLLPTASFAHAFLDHAVPAVGATISAPPGGLDLTFTESVVVALSNVRIASSGKAVAAVKATGDGKQSDTLHVHLGAKLVPGTYVVTWHVVAVDTHSTSGSYKFTVAP
jgi:methionine-rich copper-binding protein CopC